MAQLSIRDVPEDVLQALRDEAKERHTSVSRLARAAIQEIAERRKRRRSLQEILPAIDEFQRRILASRGGRPFETDSAELLSEDRAR